MNIVDMLGGLKLPNDDISNKIAVKAELKKIEREGDCIVDSILSFISRESEFIGHGLSYSGEPKQLSEEDKKELMKKLEEVIKSLPNKVKESVEDIFPSSEENKEEDKKENTEKPEEPKVEISSTQIPVQAPSVVSSVFGY